MFKKTIVGSIILFINVFKVGLLHRRHRRQYETDGKMDRQHAYSAIHTPVICFVYSLRKMEAILSFPLTLHVFTCCFEFDSTRTIYHQSLRYFVDLFIIPQGYHVKNFNEFSSSTVEKIYFYQKEVHLFGDS